MRKILKRVRPVKVGWAITRVSTTNQAMVQHGSLEQQRNMIETWVKHNFHDSEFEYRVERLIEEDVSGREGSIHKRKDLLKLKRKVENREIDFFVAEKVDRISRDQVFNLQIMREAHKQGVEVYEVESGMINFRDRGSRLGFNVKNFMAEEYSWDLEEKVTKKLRSARVHNGKDSSTTPILGLDAHPTKVGMYVRNEKEVAIVLDIANEFIKQQSVKPVLAYCKERGYKTKERRTKEKIDKEGNRIAPRLVGGVDFNTNTLKGLLLNPKLRGFGRFQDTWNQFQHLQDDEGFVAFEYPHGPIFPQEIGAEIERIYSTFEHKNVKEGSHRIYLLSGILEAPDGSPFYGESARSAQNFYYRNNKNKLRIQCDEVEKKVIARLREYFDKSGLLEEVVAKNLKRGSAARPFWVEDIQRAKMEIAKLNKAISGFTETLRLAAASGQSDLAEVAKSLLDERRAAEDEKASLEEKLKSLEARNKRFQHSVSGGSLKTFLARVMKRFDEQTDRNKKRILQSFLHRAILHENGKIELHVDLDPENGENRRRKSKNTSAKSNQVSDISCLSGHKKTEFEADSVEHSNSEFVKYGGG